MPQINVLMVLTSHDALADNDLNEANLMDAVVYGADDEKDRHRGACARQLGHARLAPV
jgi:hypothetical protein